MRIKIFLIVLFLVVSCAKKETNENAKNTTVNETIKTVYKGKVHTTTALDDTKLKYTGDLTFNDFKQPLETEVSVYINPSIEHQTFMGIGAALSDAAAETFYSLTEENQELFLKAYFDKDEGIGYSLARTIIHSCDFSSGSYTYIEEGDSELKTFSIEHDKEYRLPFTKKAIEAAGGELFQKKIHEWINSPDPNGWKYQIQNALILNYDFRLSYPLYDKNLIRVSGEGLVRVGTLNDDLELGFNFWAGRHNPYSKNNFGGWIRLYGGGRLIAHNATLQGGLFSENTYSLSYNEISPLVFRGVIELGLYYREISLCFTHTYLSKEIDSGIDHNYGSFKLVIGF